MAKIFPSSGNFPSRVRSPDRAHCMSSEKNDERMRFVRKDADQAPKREIETVLALGRAQFRRDRLFADDQFEFRNHLGHDARRDAE